MMKKESHLYIWTALLIALLIGGTFLVRFLYQKTQDAKTEEVEEQIIQSEEAAEQEYCDLEKYKYREIDGVCVDKEAEYFFYSVMIDNHYDARPSNGLADALLVYEAIVEAPITRFIAVYSSLDEVEVIGPVRSARPFYVDWAKEFNGPYVHVGGSNAALDNLKETYKYDINEFNKGRYFWRSNGRFAPHNVFTSSHNVWKVIEDNGWEPKNDFESWQFKDQAIYDERGNVEEIKVDFASTPFLVSWKYDKEDNDYTRYQGGIQRKDEDGQEIKAKNIVVMYTESKIIDDYGRRETTTVGKGKAHIFFDGQVIKGSWQRDNLASRTKFYNEGSEEIQFNRGKTWIEVVPTHFPQIEYTEEKAVELEKS